ncbi:MAG TPA: efflux RND transporter periplasmic adaptor subunit [Thermoanaerobaculia bacterium]|nr:efflux RND transporter periplasmic adaptor subunit [Thermoanaerobaculia bacterium]
MAAVGAIGAFPRRHPFLFLAVVLALLGGGGFLWWRARGRRPQYVTATVTLGNIQRNVSMTGALNPVVTVQVGSYVSGTVKSLGCDFNTEVVVGQVCATIDPVPFQLIVDQDQAEVGTAEAQLKKDQAALVYAKIAYARDSKLLAEGTVSQDTVDNDKSTLDQTVAQIGLDQASIVNKVATLKAAQVNLAYTNIVSPVIGTVITRSIDVGQTVAASLQSPTLFLIGKDLTHMQVDTNVSEADVGSIRVGQDAYFSVQAFPTKVFRGKVTQIRRGPITVQNVVTYDVVVAVANPDRILFPGMTADAHIVTDEHDNVLRVPLPAVRFNPEGLGRARGGAAGRGGEGGARAAEGGGAGGGAGNPGGPGGPGNTEAAAAGGGEARPESAAGGTSEGATAGTAGGAGAGSAAAPEGSEGRHRHQGEHGFGGPGGEGRPGGGRGGWGDGAHQHRGEGRPGGGREGRPAGGPEGGQGTAAKGGPGGHERRLGGGHQRTPGGPDGRRGAAAENGPGGAREGGSGGAGEGRRPGGRPAGGGQHRSRVWVLQSDGTLKAVPVVTGLDDGALIEVSGAGLHAGDKVVVNEITQNEPRRTGPSAPGQRQGFGQGGPQGGPPQGGPPRL